MITLDEARERLKAVVLGNESYVYPRSRAAGGDGTCVYFEDDGRPSCLVGQAFALELLEHDEDLEHNESGVDELGELFDKPARRYLEVAQASQDVGNSWGQALTDAESAVGAALSGTYFYSYQFYRNPNY